MNIEQLVQVIHNILSSDNVLRKQCEESLNAFKKASPNDFVMFMLHLLPSKFEISLFFFNLTTLL